MVDDLEKALADATILRRQITRNFTSSGIRELDEMLGGGFLPSTLTLLQQDLGSGGEIILSKLIKLQLSLSNMVLVILTDPTAAFVKDMLEGCDDDHLIVLDLVEQSKRDVNVVFDKHEISLKIREIRAHATKKLEEIREAEEDPDIQLFSIMISANPFILNLSREKVTRILYDSLLQCLEQKTIDIILMNKNILSEEMNARIQALCHSVIDLRSYFEGVQKKNDIRILKMIGRYYDVKIEPYVISFDEKTRKYDFVIKSAFLTSFETFRNLLTWNNGSISLSKVPYILAPAAYFNSLLEMPVNIDPQKGKDEIREKAQGIGRRLAIMVEMLYFVEDMALFKATLQTASLLGWGDAKIDVLEMEENLMQLVHKIHRDFNENVFVIFLDGFYRGIIKRTLNRGIRYIKVSKIKAHEQKNNGDNTVSYNLRIRLTRFEELP